jgi:hypothetical protein
MFLAGHGMLLGGTRSHFGSFKKGILPATRLLTQPSLWDVSDFS